MHDQKSVREVLRKSELGQLVLWIADRVLVQVYCKGKMALSSEVMLYINILSIILINLVIN